jgi:hypothetical protein
MRFFPACFIVVSLWWVGGCVHTQPGTGFHFSALPIRPIPIPLKGTPAREFWLQPGEVTKFSEVNQDFFFPKNCWRMLVSEEALRSGLFLDGSIETREVATAKSPNASWTAVVRPAVQEGREVQCLEVKGKDTLRVLWAIGRFSSMVWSPDSNAIAVGENRDRAMPTAYVYFPVDAGVREMSLRNDEAAAFLDRNKVRPMYGRVSVRRWIGDHLLILWYQGDSLDDNRPLWGYEILVDTAPGANDSRLLRAYVCF